MKIEQALSILGSDFEEFKVKGSCAYSPNSSICFRYSKMYNGKPIWWASEYFNRADASDYVVIAIENKGILVIPSKVIKDYWYFLKVRQLANGRTKIRIKEEDGKIVLYNNKDQQTYDVTKYLHSGDTQASELT